VSKAKDPIFTPEMNRVVAAFEQCDDLRSAALQCDISPKQVADWIEENAAFRYKIDLIESLKSSKRNVWEDEKLSDYQRRYLGALAMTGRVAHSAKCAGITPQAVTKWRSDEYFVAAESLARRLSVEVLEDEMFRRAKECGSDRLLEFALKGNMPEKYANAGGEAQTQFIKVVATDAEIAKQLAAEVDAITKGNKQ